MLFEQGIKLYIKFWCLERDEGSLHSTNFKSISYFNVTNEDRKMDTSIANSVFEIGKSGLRKHLTVKTLQGESYLL